MAPRSSPSWPCHCFWGIAELQCFDLVERTPTLSMTMLAGCVHVELACLGNGSIGTELLDWMIYPNIQDPPFVASIKYFISTQANDNPLCKHASLQLPGMKSLIYARSQASGQMLGLATIHTPCMETIELIMFCFIWKFPCIEARFSQPRSGCKCAFVGQHWGQIECTMHPANIIYHAFKQYGNT